MSGKLRNQFGGGSLESCAADINPDVFFTPAQITGPGVILAKRDCCPAQLASLELSGDPGYFILARASELPGSGAATRRRPACGGSQGLLDFGISLNLFPAPAQITGSCVILAKRD